MDLSLSEYNSNEAPGKKQNIINSQPQFQYFSVCAPEAGGRKKCAVLKFAACNKVDFTVCPGGAKLERENNLKEFKSAYDIDVLPKFGAGSEYGREQREEARKKKYGIKIKKYNPHDQPWLLKLGTGKQARRFKGTRNGGVTENASYYIFVPVSENKFVAQPVDEWYDFIPQVKYKALNAEEAEEEFSKRGKTLNHFAIMMKKRLKQNEEGINEEDDDSGISKKNKKKSDKSLLISEFDEISDDEEDDMNSEAEEKADENDDDTKKKKKTQGKKSKKKKRETDDEAEEESDDLDEGQEVDYMSGSSSDDEGMYDDAKRDESETYKDAGVEEEEGLRKLVDSDAEDDEEDESKKDDENDEEDPNENEFNSKSKDGKIGKESDSESSSGSDIDNDESLLFMMGDKKSPAKLPVSKSIVPVDDKMETTPVETNKKRKAEPPIVSSGVKKMKVDPFPTPTSGELSMEEIVRRYLLRRPTTARDLLQKLSTKYFQQNISKENLQVMLTEILKKLKPEMNKNNGKTYLFLSPANQIPAHPVDTS